MKKFLFLIILMINLVDLYSFVWVNNVDCAFIDTPDKSLLRERVVGGSVSVLKSKAYTDNFLSEYEKFAIGSFNSANAQYFIELAICELEQATVKYKEALDIGATLRYNEAVMDVFNRFNYEDYIHQNQLNREIALSAKNFFVTRDILGLYKKNLSNLNEIMNILLAIKDDLKSDKKPTISTVWSLMNKFSESALFGSYTSMIGITVSGNCGN